MMMKFVKLIWSELIIICWRRKNTIFKLIWEIYIYTQIKFYQPIKSFWFADLASFFFYCYFSKRFCDFFFFKLYNVSITKDDLLYFIFPFLLAPYFVIYLQYTWDRASVYNSWLWIYGWEYNALWVSKWEYGNFSFSFW